MTRPFFRDPKAIFACRLVLGLLFMYTAIGKIADPKEFASDVAHYRVLPYWSLHIFAFVLPWLEFITGLCLVSGIWTRAASLLMSGMLLVFIIALLQAMVRGLNIGCGCFSGASHGLGGRAIEDMGLLWMSWYLVVQGPGYRLERDPSLDRPERHQP